MNRKRLKLEGQVGQKTGFKDFILQVVYMKLRLSSYIVLKRFKFAFLCLCNNWAYRSVYKVTYYFIFIGSNKELCNGRTASLKFLYQINTINLNFIEKCSIRSLEIKCYSYFIAYALTQD